MAIEIRFTVTRTGAMPDATALHSAMRAGVRQGAEIVQAIAIQNVSGKVLKAPTGQLRSSIATKITDREKATEASIGTNVIHGLIHEFGVQRPWTIEPRGDGVLSWISQNKRVFARSVQRTGMQARPWLVPALREGTDAVVKAIATRVANVFQAGSGPST